jgi:hypothetical protein
MRAGHADPAGDRLQIHAGRAQRAVQLHPIIWATLFGLLVFGDWPASNIIIGAAIIVMASVFMVLRESYLARPPGPATD